MERKRYLVGGVKPSLKIKWENPRKQNQTDFKELHEYAHTGTIAKSNLLSFNKRHERLSRPTGKVSSDNIDQST